MSAELAKKAREAAKAKAERMTTDPHQRVDASSWTPGKMDDSSAPDGLRPISKRQFKRGGKVEGEKAAGRADRKPRATGGMTAGEYINRDVRKANDERDGAKHDGGFKRGGRTGKDIGGSLSMLSPALMIANAIRGKKDDGDPGSAQVVGKKGGGRVARATGGTTGADFKAATARRDALESEAQKHSQTLQGFPKGNMGMTPEHVKNSPEFREARTNYDRAHSQLRDFNSGYVKQFKNEIRAANPRFARKSGGKVNVNVIVGSKGDQSQPPQMMPPRPPMPMPAPPMAAAPPPAPPPGLGAGPGPGAPPPMGGPPPANMMPRKSGGRTYRAGAGSGEGRMEKIEAYGKSA